MSGGRQTDLGSAANLDLPDGPNGPSRYLRDLRSDVEELYTLSEASRFGISIENWTRTIAEIVDKYLDRNTTSYAVHEFLKKLRVQELALARACESGSEPAWDDFLSRYREGLYEAALGIARNDVRGREIADSIYGDLLGVTANGEQRVSKLHSYSGIGSLAGWLRTVLAQSFIDRYRYEQRFVEADEEQLEDFTTDLSEPAATVDARLEQATNQALAGLPEEDRFILLCYFLDGQTLADLARTTHVHVSTVSRRIEKITTALRKDILRRLQSAGMSRAQATEALEVDVRDLEVHVRRQLEKTSQNTSFGSFS